MGLNCVWNRCVVGYGGYGFGVETFDDVNFCSLIVAIELVALIWLIAVL